METDKNFLQGYNAGFKLRKFSPELYDLLKDSLNADNEYQKGVIDGAEQADLEAENERLTELNELSEDQEPNKDEEREQ